MTSSELDEIEERANAATPVDASWFPGDERKSALYLHAREDVPELIAEVRKLKALLKKIEFRGDHSELAECCPDCVGYPKHEDDCELAEALK